MKHLFVAFALTVQSYAGGFLIYEVPSETEPKDNCIVIESWAGGAKTMVRQSHAFSSDDIVRIIVKKQVVPAVTQEQIDKALDRMSEEQRKKYRGALKPEVETEMISLSFVLTNDATKRFRTITDDNVGKKLAVVIGGKVFSMPEVRKSISDGVVQVSERLKNADGLLTAFPSSDPKVFVDKDLSSKK